MEEPKGNLQIRGNGQLLLHLISFLIVYLYLLHAFPPYLLFSKTIVAGGDTPSHFATAKYLKSYLFSHGKIMGWDPGSLGGYPLFYLYFPLPFLLTALLSYAIPLEVAFKIVTVSGTFLLPVCLFLSLRLFSFPFPVPILGAVFSLPFLFNEGHKIWGGNIMSTLTGEFSYSFSFAFFVLALGLFHRCFRDQRYLPVAALVTAVIGLSHGYSFLLLAACTTFFLFLPGRFRSGSLTLARVLLLAFLLMAFWLLPALRGAGFTTPSSAIWGRSFFQIFPPLLLPFLAAAIFAVAPSLWQTLRSAPQKLDTRILFLIYSSGCIFFFFASAYLLAILDIRFLPFLQIMVIMLAAIFLGRRLEKSRGAGCFVIATSLLVLVWTDLQVKESPGWIRWNYSGLEAKASWPLFQQMMKALRGNVSSPRVAYEDSELHGIFGSMRIFEALPLFSGRSTLGGIHMLSSLSTPPIFFLQGEISREIMFSIPEYGCFTFSPSRAAQHLRLFNVSDVIARTPDLKKILQSHEAFQLRGRFGPYEIYSLRTHENRYVVPLKFAPVLCTSHRWKKAAYRWFRRGNDLDVPLVFVQDPAPEDRKYFQRMVQEPPAVLPHLPLSATCEVREKVEEEKIEIWTSERDAGQRPPPLLIKVSYHPNWKVEGAEKIYPVSPTFMLVFPRQRHVVLRFQPGSISLLGGILTIAGVVLLVVWLFQSASDRIPASGTYEAAAEHYSTGSPRKWGTLFLALVILDLLLALLVPQTEPIRMLQKGMDAYARQDNGKAEKVLSAIVREHPETGEASNASFYLALGLERMGKTREMISALRRYREEYPDSLLVPESLYREGVALSATGDQAKARLVFKALLSQFPSSPWSKAPSEAVPENSLPVKQVKAQQSPKSPP